MYRIRDLQFSDRYFGGGSGREFKTKKEICDTLIFYHSGDCDMKEEENLLKQGEIEKCLSALCDFEWEVEEIKN